MCVAGSEFKAHPFQALLEMRGVHHFYAGGSGKATIVERFFRTMRAKIARYQYRQNTMRYIDVLDSLVEGYNKTYHRSIQMRPIDVTVDNDHIVYDTLYQDKMKVRSFYFS